MKIVFTGPPGSGKSSVFKYFENHKFYFTAPEVARDWIDWFKAHEPYNLPWNNREYFQQLIETHQVKAWIERSDYNKDSPVIFDRALPDEIGYRCYLKMDVPERLQKACKEKYRYDKVFYFPYWDEIYMSDETRVETKEEAQKIDSALRFGYLECGYELIEVPKGTIEERIDFIKKHK